MLDTSSSAPEGMTRLLRQAQPLVSEASIHLLYELMDTHGADPHFAANAVREACGFAAEALHRDTVPSGFGAGTTRGAAGGAVGGGAPTGGDGLDRMLTREVLLRVPRFCLLVPLRTLLPFASSAGRLGQVVAPMAARMQVSDDLSP